MVGKNEQDFVFTQAPLRLCLRDVGNVFFYVHALFQLQFVPK